MKKIQVVTAFSPAGYREYGGNFLRTFSQFWPLNKVSLTVFVEELIPNIPYEQILLKNVSGCLEFIYRHKLTPLHCGTQDNGRWKNREIESGYSYKWDAVKFARQAYIAWHAGHTLGEGRMLWLDGDVVTYNHVDLASLIKMIDQAPVTYLGRGASHPEIGYQGYRLPEALPFLDKWKNLYDTDEVFRLPEWHSAWTYKWCIDNSPVESKDLTPGGTGHVWFQSPLGKWSDHLKGNRKERGFSKERFKL